jgi:hydrogenase maturation factor
MCTSRYFRVLETIGGDALIAAGNDGHRHRLSLLAYDGPAPQQGSWVVAHSGYALAPCDPSEAADLAVTWQALDGVDDRSKEAS